MGWGPYKSTVSEAHSILPLATVLRLRLLSVSE